MVFLDLSKLTDVENTNKSQVFVFMYCYEQYNLYLL